MNRRLLAFLVGGAAAARSRVVIMPAPTPTDRITQNGECPVCHEMAEPHAPQVRECITGHDIQTLQPTTICKQLEPRLVRCQRCSNAFWQDAEAA